MKKYLKKFYEYQDFLFWNDDVDNVDTRIERWLKTKKSKIDFGNIRSDFIKYRNSIDGKSDSVDSFIYFLENNELSPFSKNYKDEN